MTGKSYRVNLTVNRRLYERFSELRKEAQEILGEKVEFSPYVNATLKGLVETLELFLKKKKEGQLTPDFMISYFYQLTHKESQKVIKEAKKGGQKKP